MGRLFHRQNIKNIFHENSTFYGLSATILLTNKGRYVYET